LKEQRAINERKQNEIKIVKERINVLNERESLLKLNQSENQITLMKNDEFIRDAEREIQLLTRHLKTLDDLYLAQLQKRIFSWDQNTQLSRSLSTSASIPVQSQALSHSQSAIERNATQPTRSQPVGRGKDEDCESKVHFEDSAYAFLHALKVLSEGGTVGDDTLKRLTSASHPDDLFWFTIPEMVENKVCETNMKLVEIQGQNLVGYENSNLTQSVSQIISQTRQGVTGCGIYFTYQKNAMQFRCSLCALNKENILVFYTNGNTQKLRRCSSEEKALACVKEAFPSGFVSLFVLQKT